MNKELTNRKDSRIIVSNQQYNERESFLRDKP